MEDRLGIGNFPVITGPVSGVAQRKVLDKLEAMERHVAHVQTAVRDMQNAVRLGQPGRNLSSAVMNSRNWILTIIFEHCYIQTSLEGGGASTGSAYTGIQAEFLYRRAAVKGAEEAKRERYLISNKLHSAAGYPSR